MVIRLHVWLGDDSFSLESWLQQQADYDLWQALNYSQPTVKPYSSAKDNNNAARRNG